MINLELLLLAMVTYSLLRNEGADNDDNVQLSEQLKMKFSIMAINNRIGDQSAVSKALLVIAQRLLSEQLRSLDGGENEGPAVVSSAASDHQLIDSTAAAKTKKKKAIAAAAKKKKRNRRNKAAAKYKGTKLMSCLGGGIISLFMMAALFGSITTLISLSLIHQSDGSSEGKASPTLPPSTSTSLRQRDLQSSNVASTSPSSVSPSAAVVQAPIFSPADVSNPPVNTFDKSAPSTCFDTPNWVDYYGLVCDNYEVIDEPGCPQLGSLHEGNMGVAKDNCCYCGGGSHTLPPTTSPKSMCNDTSGWYNFEGYDCSWYEVFDDPGCPKYGNQTADNSSTAKGSAKDNCCYCQNAVVSTLVSKS
jgi:hypothetical protein